MTGHNARRRAHQRRARRIDRARMRRFNRRHEVRPVRLRLAKMDAQLIPDEPAHYEGWWKHLARTMSTPSTVPFTDAMEQNKPTKREPLLSDDDLLSILPSMGQGVEYERERAAQGVRAFYESKITSGELLTKAQHASLVEEAVREARQNDAWDQEAADARLD